MLNRVVRLPNVEAWNEKKIIEFACPFIWYQRVQLDERTGIVFIVLVAGKNGGTRTHARTVARPRHGQGGVATVSERAEILRRKGVLEGSTRADHFARLLPRLFAGRRRVVPPGGEHVPNDHVQICGEDVSVFAHEISEKQIPAQSAPRLAAHLLSNRGLRRELEDFFRRSGALSG